MNREQPEISAAEQAYLLAIRQSRGGDPLSAADLARRMSVSPQATSEMLRRLSAADLVTIGENRSVRLSSKGSREADAIYRRHALVEWLLSSVLGIPWAETDPEAIRLQSHISPRVEAALDELLGHPETCPHGNPIDEATDKKRPTGLALSDVDAGMHITVYRITEAAEDDGGLVSYLQARGLRPGAEATVLARSESTDSLTLDGPLGRVTLGLRPARLIRVLEGEPDPALFHQVPSRDG